MSIERIYAITGTVLLLGAVYFAGRAGVRRLIDWWDDRANPGTEDDEPVAPKYPPAFEEVLEGHVMATDELGDWAPTEHVLEPASIADDLMAERPWQTLHKPPSWSSWTGAHPVVRLADLAAFGATA